jgi:Xaa-Pro aminopeptidase
MLASILKQRRQHLAQSIDFPVILWSGAPPARNFPANVYPFRASSHFLYFAGLPLANAAIELASGKLTLFMDDSTPEDALWHGPTPSRDEIAAQIGADAAYPYQHLIDRLKVDGLKVDGLKTTQSPQAQSWSTVGSLPNDLAIYYQSDPTLEQRLTHAIVQSRLTHDAWALAEIRRAAAVSVQAHEAGMAKTAEWARLSTTTMTEAHVRAAMEQVIISSGMDCAYNSIVTVHGEVLHNHHYHHPLKPGDLLLADVGAETETGWASDITRTWPVNGRFSSTQRDLYDVVLAAHDACIHQAKPGVEYRSLHLLACHVIAQGLVDLGILRGNPEDLVAQDAHALFFPHGVGHLLGLDVHDMEDLGDLAGYAPERQRSDRFGLCFLRLDRPLQSGMVVTIEPGFYQVPGILEAPSQRERYHECVNWDKLAQFEDVRGIRIEDDVYITNTGCEVLTQALTTDPEKFF